MAREKRIEYAHKKLPKKIDVSPKIKTDLKKSKCLFMSVIQWEAYDAGLKQRGSLRMWLTPQVIKAWYLLSRADPARRLHLFCVGDPNANSV